MNEIVAQKDIMGLETELENFDREYEHGRWLKNQGRLSTTDQLDLEGRRAHILLNQDVQNIVNEFITSSKNPEFRRILLVLDRLIKYAKIESNQTVYEIRSRIEQAIGNYPIKITGKNATRNDVRQILRYDKNAKLRQEALHCFDELSRQVEQDVIDLVAHRNTIAQEMGYAHFGELCLLVQGLSRTQLSNWFTSIIQSTDSSYQSYLGKSAQKLNQPRLYQQDLAYSFCRLNSLPDEYFPSKKLSEAIFWLADRINITEALARVRIDHADIPFQGICVTIHVPDDIRILIDPADGHRDYLTFFHEVGHAMHSSYITQPHHLFRDEPGPFCEGMAQTMARFVDDPILLSSFVKLPEEYIGTNKGVWGTYIIYHMRELITQAEFEWQMYAKPEINPLESYQNTIQEFLMVPGSEDLAWANNIYWASYPFYVQNYVIAEMIASQTHAALHKKYGQSIHPDCGEWLKQNYWNLGGSVEWSDKIYHATGRGISPEELIQEMVQAHPPE